MSRKKRKKPRLFDDLAGILDDLVEHDNEPEPPPKDRETPRALVMFWRREKCSKCHHVYESSCYDTDLLLQSVIERPIVHFGKLYGWAYKAVVYRQVGDLAFYDNLPRRVETIERTIRVCPRCVHRPQVIYLPEAG